jgi:hypothetical protein
MQATRLAKVGPRVPNQRSVIAVQKLGGVQAETT